MGRSLQFSALGVRLVLENVQLEQKSHEMIRRTRTKSVLLACLAMPASTMEMSMFNSEQWSERKRRRLNNAGYFAAKMTHVRTETSQTQITQGTHQFSYELDHLLKWKSYGVGRKVPERVEQIDVGPLRLQRDICIPHLLHYFLRRVNTGVPKAAKVEPEAPIWLPGGLADNGRILLDHGDGGWAREEIERDDAPDESILDEGCKRGGGREEQNVGGGWAKRKMGKGEREQRSDEHTLVRRHHASARCWLCYWTGALCKRGDSHSCSRIPSDSPS